VRTGGFTPPTPGIGMNVEVKDPDMKIILSRVCILHFLLDVVQTIVVYNNIIITICLSLIGL